MTINFHNFNFRLSILLILCILTLCGADAQVVKRITAVTSGEDATNIPYSGPVYEFLYEYDSWGRVSSARFKVESRTDSDYVDYFSYSEKQIRIKLFHPYFLWYVYQTKKIDNGLLIEDNIQYDDNEWAVFDKVEPNHYTYDDNKRLTMYKDRYQELHFTRGADGNIAEVPPYLRNSVPCTLTIEYSDAIVDDAALKLGSLIPLLGIQDFAFDRSLITSYFSHGDFTRLSLIWGGFLGKPDTKLISRMTEVSNYSYPYHTPTTHIKTLEFHYTIDDRGLITAVDAVTTDDYYYETPVQELYGWTEAHQHRTTHFDIEWDTETSAIHQPQLAEANGSDTYYSLSGERLPAPRKGLNIIRTKDGQTRKVLVR